MNTLIVLAIISSTLLLFFTVVGLYYRYKDRESQ